MSENKAKNDSKTLCSAHCAGDLGGLEIGNLNRKGQPTSRLAVKDELASDMIYNFSRRTV